MARTSDLWGAQRAPACGLKDINSVDGTHLPKVSDTAINPHESLCTFSPTCMSNHGELAGLCRRRGRKRMRTVNIEGDGEAAKDTDTGEDGGGKKGDTGGKGSSLMTVGDHEEHNGKEWTRIEADVGLGTIIEGRSFSSDGGGKNSDLMAVGDHEGHSGINRMDIDTGSGFRGLDFDVVDKFCVKRFERLSTVNYGIDSISSCMEVKNIPSTICIWVESSQFWLLKERPYRRKQPVLMLV